MNFLKVGDVLEETLNDIDEFIQSGLGFAPLSAGDIFFRRTKGSSVDAKRKGNPVMLM